MTADGLDLRSLIAQVVREVVAEAAADTVRQQLAGGLRPPSVVDPGPEPRTVLPSSSRDIVPAAPGAEFVTRHEQRQRTEKVHLGSDTDLDKFVRHLLALFDNPKNRQDLRTGRLRFQLARAHPTTAATAVGPAVRVESGAVTERQVLSASESGRRLILGRRAILTPLGREKARALGVTIERER